MLKHENLAYLLNRQTWRLPRDQILVGYAKIFDEGRPSSSDFWDIPPRDGARIEATDIWLRGEDKPNSQRVIYWGQRNERHSPVRRE